MTNIFDQLARCKPVNKQAGIVTSGATKAPVWNDDVIKYNAEKLRLQQQEAFNRVANTYVKELARASHGNYYAKDFVGFARKKIRKGEWTPGIDAHAPKKWVGLNPKKARAVATSPGPGRINKKARREARVMAAMSVTCPGLAEQWTNAETMTCDA
jgi:hypothetical protein